MTEVTAEVFEKAAEHVNNGWVSGDLVNEYGCCLIGALGLALELDQTESAEVWHSNWYATTEPFVRAMGFNTASDAWQWNDELINHLIIAAITGDRYHIISFDELTTEEKEWFREIYAFQDDFLSDFKEQAKHLVFEQFMATAKDLRNQGK